MTQNTIQKISTNATWAEVLLVIGAVVAFIFLLPVSLDRQAQADCLKWQSYAKDIRGFYLTKEQKAQCDDAKITINAPVK